MKKKILVCLAIVVVLGAFAVGQGRAEEKDKLTSNMSGYAQIEWPDTDIAHSVPTPASATGKVAVGNEKSVVAEVANTSDANYQEYVEKCKSAGFANNAVDADGMYAADNGVYTLMVTMNDDHVMNISMNVVE